MPIGKKLYILEWVLFAAALVPAIFAQAVPADARGPWYMAALALVLVSAALQALRWWGPERYAFTPVQAPSSGPEQSGSESEMNGSGFRAGNSSQTTFRYSFAPRSVSSIHSTRVIIVSIVAFLILLYTVSRSAAGDQVPIRIWVDLIVLAGAIAFRLLFGWPDDKPVRYKSGWRSIRSTGSQRKHSHKHKD
jgi:hypothetical protein